MALIPKTMVIKYYFEIYNRPYFWAGQTIEVKGLRQDMFEVLYKSLDFCYAYYLNPGISHGNVLHTQYWDKMLNLFGVEVEE